MARKERTEAYCAMIDYAEKLKGMGYSAEEICLEVRIVAQEIAAQFSRM